MKFGKIINKTIDVMFWILVFMLVGSSVWDVVHYSMYGQLFDFRWNSIFIWSKGIVVGFGGCAWIGYKFGMYRGAKSKKCCLQIQNEARK